MANASNPTTVGKVNPKQAPAVSGTAPTQVAPATASATATSWQYTATPYTGKGSPAPRQGTVGYALLLALANGPVPLATAQAAVAAVGCKGAHPVKALCAWLAKHRGYAFTCTNGQLRLG